MLNRIVIIGRLTRQPELRITPSGVSVTTITVAVDRRPTQTGQRATDFIDVVLFGKLAEITCRYMDKGRLVAVEGRLQSRSYETKDGQRRRVWEVVADSIQFLDRARNQDQMPSEPIPGAGPDDEDIPTFTE
ncbi:MAG TPA: single-stranded DNA-binding protein [Firmicutes bacterium]|mgnify:CR=1 FL=1|nr:single-stranded DNA-binding protein [Bacillota bacterium]